MARDQKVRDQAIDMARDQKEDQKVRDQVIDMARDQKEDQKVRDQQDQKARDLQDQKASVQAIDMARDQKARDQVTVTASLKANLKVNLKEDQKARAVLIREIVMTVVQEKMIEIRQHHLMVVKLSKIEKQKNREVEIERIVRKIQLFMISQSVWRIQKLLKRT